MKADAIIVGCGLTGGVIARYLAEHGLNVVILERRNHIAGNMFDYTDENGILVQKYGPHVFHTVRKDLFDYVNRFCGWFDFRVSCMAEVCGKLTPSPFNFRTIDQFYSPEKAELLKQHLRLKYGDADKATIVELLQSDDPIIKEYADFLFAEDYAPYTAKQWGISPCEVDSSVLKRVPVLFSYNSHYFDDEFQAMPEKGFTAFFEKMISHPNIRVQLNTNALDYISVTDGKLVIDGKEAGIPVIYTGAADELLDSRYGTLPYRSLRFSFRTESTDSFQETPIVAYPKAEGYTRITEYTKMPAQKLSGKTVIALEYPQPYQAGETEPYYPILTEKSIAMYEKYKLELQRIPNLYLCGRLADFKYYNMDQAIDRALEVCGKLNADLNLGGAK